MRIQNNITAMNTHRMYTINNDNVAKSAEKLSSGYRINRAGDDAAGLAISEKMRSQIRGLNMATKNSQDAISLVQTAEGALQETHSMLQRMNELAVQAATGTNEGIDRNALAKEFEQLKKEINDVAEQTNFNNMKILDGSLSYEGYQRSAATSGVTNTITELTPTKAGAADAPTAAMSSEITTAGAAAVTKQDGKATVDVSNDQILKAGTTVTIEIKNEKGEVARLKTTVGSADLDLSDPDDMDTFTKQTWVTDGTNANKFGGTANGLAVAVGDGSDGKLEITVTGDTTADRTSDFDMGKLQVSIDFNHSGQAVEQQNVTQTQELKNAKAATKGEMLITIDPEQVKVGDTFKVGDNEFKIYSADDPDALANGIADADGKYTVRWNGKTGADSDLVKNMAAAIATPNYSDGAGATNAKVTTKAIGTDKILVTASTTGDAAAEAQLTFEGPAGAVDDADAKNPYEGRTNTIEFDIAKMKDGDTFDVTVKGADGTSETKSVTYEGETRADFMKKVEEKLGDFGDVKGNALIIKDRDVSIELNERWKTQEYAGETNAIRIQVGALENEQLAVSIDSMNTAGLGLDTAFLTKVGNSDDANIDLAGAAITATRAAINKVSDQRATLGAMQNRLDHKIANLKVSSENLSAAESRIRDVDMAQEMTNFTKNNILSQAATAMLAQANSLPQNVLSLLG